MRDEPVDLVEFIIGEPACVSCRVMSPRFFELGSQLKTTKLRNYVLSVAFRAACCDVCTTPGSSRMPARLGFATKSTKPVSCRVMIQRLFGRSRYLKATKSRVAN